jgi:hypothetical protein
MGFLTLLALALFAGAHYLAHGAARHQVARALGVPGTKLVLEIRDADAYGASPRIRRIVAAAAGPTANYLLCALAFLIVSLLAGNREPTLIVQVGTIAWPGSIAVAVAANWARRKRA